MTEDKSQVRFLYTSISCKHFWSTASFRSAKMIYENVKIQIKTGRETDGQDFQRLLNGVRATTCIKDRMIKNPAATGDDTATSKSSTLPYLYGNSCNWDDFFHPDGGSVRHGELAVGGLLRSSTDGHLPAGLPAHIAEGPGGQSFHPILNEILIQQGGHCLANQQEPTLTEQKHQACI